MDRRDKKQALIQFINDNPRLVGYSLVALYVLINNTINATSKWMEVTRSDSYTTHMWEPFVWEYTSAIGVFVLLPLLFKVFDTFPPRFTRIRLTLLVHLFASLVFAVLHVTIMVLMREGIYIAAGMDYNFGNIAREFIYEYRKDAWGYAFFYTLFHLCKLAFSRLYGDADLVAKGETFPQSLQHFLVKKLDKEFLIEVQAIDWMEASGNYVNLHADGRIYPMRGTLTQVTERIAANGFSRVQRSASVNHAKIQSIEYNTSGDGVITLKNGHTLPLSRRYKDAFKQQFG